MFSPQKRLIYSGLLLIILATVAIRLPLLEVPLERDEGEYAYAGQLILQGIPPYIGIYSMKLPGIYGIYALIMAAFGQTPKGIHLGLLFINIATIIMIFFLAQKLINSIAGISSAACFAFLSIGRSVQGIFANSEHFVIYFVLCSSLLLVHGRKNNKTLPIFLSGIFAGSSFLVKQNGIAFIAFGAIYILTQKYSDTSISLKQIIYNELFFIIGAILPYLLTMAYFYHIGIFDKFRFWTFDYAMTYATLVPPSIAWKIFFRNVVPIVISSPAIWIVSFSGLIAVLAGYKKLGFDINYFILFNIFSFIAICPGFYFRPHYFILILPAVSIMFGIGATVLSDQIGKIYRFNHNNTLAILIVLICISTSLYRQYTFLLQLTPSQASRFTYGLNPFPESIELGDIIQKITQKEDRIAVLGSEPQIYFYSKRRAATGYVYMYPLMEQHNFAKQMQIEMVHEIEKSEPEILIFVNVYTSWLKYPNSHQYIFEWFNDYKKYYRTLGLIELRMDKTFYHWIPDLDWPPKSSTWLLIMKRKNKKSF